MPFISRRPTLRLTEGEATWLRQLSQSRSEPAGRVQRAEILLRYHGGQTVSGIAARLRTNRPRVERCLAKALELGVRGALQDLPGRGRRQTLSAEARAWVVALACQKPKELGYAQELWTTRLLAQHIRRHCKAAGHSSLQHLARGTVSKILRAQPVQPHKIEYYLERRDAEFEAKMKQVLHVYRQVELWHQAGAPAELTAVLSYDEKPGIQALANTAPDLAPVPGRHVRVGRDQEYVRHGTLSLLAGIDLWSGEVLGLVRDRHRSVEFIEFLRLADAQYPGEARIRMVLDNHSAHLSRETRNFLATVPNRFEFIFTPTHGSWLNLIESFFGKMARTLLRGIRVKSKEELKTRIEMYLREVNEEPVVFRWKYKLETFSVA
ncbi:MAG TPA: IS630 family transposase [Terriglobia bacterium]|nr:IS630 family transposase [Terriglobia bacterium]